MARRSWVVLGLAAVSILAVPAAAQAYTPPEEPSIEVLDEPPDVVPDEPVDVLVDNFLPNSAGVFTVAADGVDGADIGLSVKGSKSIDVTVGADGSYVVTIVFPVAATYTLTASGLDLDGNPTSVSTTVEVTAEGGLPGTGFSGQDALVGGLALIGAGIAAIVLARRRKPVLV
jgi:hypothetical protein